ncbi:MAG: precorrin-6y C5,15-methyltransferase (decarboxylating) subunit CbiE [Rhodospirillales bacterium]|nr:precorrin-6y C5,15-methyltransferase (decarboxylating) subunit CbiE [Rhodospirillales bacterium]
MTPRITVVGIGEDGLDGLSLKARELIEGADVLVGGARHLGKIPEDPPGKEEKSERIDWSDGFDETFDKIEKLKDKRVVVLASGDPLNFGVGTNLVRRFGAAALDIIPAPGAFSLAAARMGWPLAETECLTVHGRALEAINLYLVPGQRLLILSWDATTPAQVASLLSAKGFGKSILTVLADIGGADEARSDGVAADWNDKPGSDLNTIAVDCVAGDDAVFYPRIPGLPDDAFEHDGLITKREVRAATLARLMPLPGNVLWDVGGGSGAIGIEWLRAQPNSTVFAIERDAKRFGAIKRNAANLGVPKLTVVEGEAPGAFKDLDAPDAVFLGGGVSVPGLLEACWGALNAGGRLVANAVTVEAEQRLLAFQNEFGGDLTRIAVSRAAPVGSLHTFRPLKEVTQLVSIKK